MITVKSAADACQAILGAIPTVHISSGVFMVSVLLGDAPVITVTPVSGQALIATRAWLKARPPKSATLFHTASKKDEDWQQCTTASHRDLYAVLRRAAEPLEYRATLAERIAVQLGGAEGRRLSVADPRYWLALARWVDGSRQLSWNDSKFARIYARKLRTGGQINPSFRSWAIGVSRQAESLGFVPVEYVAEEQSCDGDEVDEEFPEAAPEVVDATVLARMLERIRTLDAPGIAAASRAIGPDDDRRRRLRVTLLRAGTPQERYEGKRAVVHEFDDLRSRIGPVPGMEELKSLAIDVAIALVVAAVLPAETTGAIVAEWDRVLSTTNGRDGDFTSSAFDHE